jgi:acyl carrier protein
VEKRFGISVADVELIPDNFDSVQKLGDYIQRKVSAKA